MVNTVIYDIILDLAVLSDDFLYVDRVVFQKDDKRQSGRRQTKSGLHSVK